MRDRPIHVSLVAFPDAVVSTLTGIYDVLNSFGMLKGFHASIPPEPPFTIEIVGQEAPEVMLASGIPVRVHKRCDEVDRTDIIIAPSVILEDGCWRHGRYPELTAWIDSMHRQGALLCSACSGVFLLAETGAFDGREVTVHWGYDAAFRQAYPRIPVFPEKVLLVSGDANELVSSGAAMTWHDLVLYLIARYVGNSAAQAVARFFALQWHHDGVTPYVVFKGRTDHRDAAIREVQDWLATKFSVASPVEEMMRRSGLAERTLTRRFKAATGLSPLAYVQRLRIESAKRLLEDNKLPIDEIAWRCGYEDPAFFRRLFKRTTGMAPGSFRKRFSIPEFTMALPGTE
ncbi:HTH-type transcriptional regulator CdhR [Defluviimonas aquaemixtae]|uniref:HTH-type transcriptional regulator CdhR n=1 Tax=Albidovulum aquaemixtae TaxID=1542388 RepID=A0A2R8B6E3_9RHOB|nr:helix-turn-helix domain-containing protein [Defluviimonas aquaemixtae]SPH18126.1 HTH-type transcriptional regulator CdhR [Defluviimonas aquaemixtae]